MTNYKIFFVYKNKESLLDFEKAFQKTKFPKIQYKKLLIKVLSLEKFNNIQADISDIKVVYLSQFTHSYEDLINNISEAFINDTKCIYTVNYKTFTITSKIVQYFNPEETAEYLFGCSSYEKVKQDLIQNLNNKLNYEYKKVEEYELSLEKSKDKIIIFENAKNNLEDL